MVVVVVVGGLQVIYERGGTLRQFLQDDKGLLAICVFGMPPGLQHDSDPLRGVLSALDIRDRLAALGLRAGIGVTTGRAYSGFVGSDGRREMCAMGSVVNMAARLMCKAEGGVLVDRATYERASLAVAAQPFRLNRHGAEPPHRAGQAVWGAVWGPAR